MRRIGERALLPVIRITDVRASISSPLFMVLAALPKAAAATLIASLSRVANVGLRQAAAISFAKAR